MKTKQLTAILLAIAVLFSLSCVHAFAATEATASVPVKLTVANEYRSISVTVPASLPVEIYNGTVVTATNAKITNNAKFGSVKVKAVSVKDGSFKIGNYDVFTGSKTIALKLNGISTKRAGNLEISQSAFPVIAPQESLPLRYFAKVSKDAAAMKDKEVAKVVFTLALAD
ncbi:MAG: hypothetical protein IKD72_06500 [Clostridia bacterium]|nr:hypothetical protein [Clostridia bacterium]